MAMLSKKTYTFNKININNLDKKHSFYIFGDNLLESMQIIKWLSKFNDNKMNFLRIDYVSFSKFVYVYKINGEEYYFIASSYYRDGALPNKIIPLISNIDKPDAIVYSPYLNKVLFGFESTSSTLAGNATWQRTGRTINFLNNKIPFAFLAYGSKVDQSDINPGKKPRTPSGIFILLYLILTMKYLTPALVGFFEHSDPRQSLGIPGYDDFRSDVFKYLFSILFEHSDEQHIKLKTCLKNMTNYYKTKIVPKNEFSPSVRDYITSDAFIDKLLNSIVNKVPLSGLFKEEDILLYKWKPKNLSNIVQLMFPNIEFWQLSKNCKAGICFDTSKIIDVIDKSIVNSNYSSAYLKKIEEPTIIIPIKLTKKENGKIIPTDDPYNGEISAFSELYLQSFPNANIMILLTDHTLKNEYNVELAETRKIYKSISRYADIVIDMDYKIFNHFSSNSDQVNRSRFETTKITEDSVTCFFETILMHEKIEPSFLNPPCGSWSDMRLYPTDLFYYYKRNDERADIAYFNSGVYYIGESKDYFSSLKSTIEKEYEKVKTIEKILKDNLSNLNIDYKTFAIFYGKEDDAIKVFDSSNFDYCAILDEDDDSIYMRIKER